jgi:predicted amidohydrolase YtcJ
MQLYINAHIYTMAEREDWCSAMLVDAGRVVELFTSTPSHIQDAQIIDLQGAWVFAQLRTTPAVSGMIFAFHFDEHAILEQRFPTLAELDAIFPSTPLILRRVDGHSCVINSAAAKAINWEEPLPADFDGYLFQRPNDVAAKSR